MSCGLHPQWIHAAEDCPLCTAARLRLIAEHEMSGSVNGDYIERVANELERGVKQETHDFAVRYAEQADRELATLRSVVASLVNWARSRQPDYPFDHNGECLICDEMGEHADDCTWLIVERSVFAVPDCLCRTSNCGHEASKHVGPYGACIVPGCDCGPRGWS